MAWRPVLRLGLLLVLLAGARAQAPAGGAAPAPAPVAGAGAAAAGAAGAAGRGRLTRTMTTRAEHPFCTNPPMARRPKMPIFHLDVKTGFHNGYRSNQSVIVEVTAKYEEVWRINQVFLIVPDRNPYNYPSPATAVYNPSTKVVGYWGWHMSPNASDPNIGGTQPVDCGGISSYGPFGMLSSMGAHAAKEYKDLNNQDSKGYSKIVAKWIPPSSWQDIIYKKMITIEAYVTFEKTPPGSYPQMSFTHPHYNRYGAPQPARWIKKEATLLNLDYIDIHNYLRRFQPYMNMMSKFMIAIKR